MAIFSTIGALIGADAQKDGTKEAGRIAERTADKTIALHKDIYNQNRATMTPTIDRGNIAGAYYNAMLGLPSALPQQSGPAVNALIGPQGGTPMARNGVMRQDYVETISGDPFQRGVNALMAPQASQTTAQPQAPGMNPTAVDAQGAFRTYIDNSDYGFKFNSGSNALAHQFAAGGKLNSGAAMRDYERFKQDIQSGYRGEWMGHLGNQMGMGMSGASALAGVGQNYAMNVGAANQSAGTVAANGALARGNITANMWGGIGSNIGNSLGKILGSSYGFGG